MIELHRVAPEAFFYQYVHYNSYFSTDFSTFQWLIARYLNGPSGVAVTPCAAKGNRPAGGSSHGTRHRAEPGVGNWSRRGTALERGARGATSDTRIPSEVSPRTGGWDGW